MRTALIQASGALTRFRTALTQASGAGTRLRTSVSRNSTELQKLRGSAQQAASGVTTAARAAGTGGGLFNRFGQGLRTATTAQRGLNAAMKANVLGALLALVLPLITRLVDMAVQSKTVQAVVQKAMQVIGQVMGVTMRAASAAVGWLVDAARNLINWLKGNWPLIIAILTGPVGIAVLAIVRNWDRIKEAVASVRNWIVDKWNDAIAFLASVPGRIAGFFTELPGKLRSMGSDMIQGLINGIRHAAGALLSTVKNFIIDKIPGPIRSALGISSPSKVMMGFGKDVSEGLALGIEGGGNRVAGAAGRLATVVARGTIGPGHGLHGTAAARTPRATGTTAAPAAVTVHVHPRPGQSEYEIGRITARELAWAGKR
jgi:hypothetical protein